MPQTPTWEETVEIPTWEDTVAEGQPSEIKAAPLIKLSPYEQANLESMMAGRGKLPTGMEAGTGLVTAIAEDPERFLQTPLVPIPRIEAKSTLGKIAAAPVNVAGGLIQGMETPLGVLTLGLGGPVAKAAFAGLAAKSAGEQLGTASVTGDPGQIAEGILGAGLGPAIALHRTLPPSPAPVQGPLATGAIFRSPERGVPTALGNEELQAEAAKQAAILAYGRTAKVQDLRPAVKTMEGEVVAGEKGQSHNDIIEQNKIPATDVDKREFVDQKTGQELSREQVATAIPTEKPGEAHSSDLTEAQQAAPPPEPAAAPKAEPSGATPTPVQPKGLAIPLAPEAESLLQKVPKDIDRFTGNHHLLRAALEQQSAPLAIAEGDTYTVRIVPDKGVGFGKGIIVVESKDKPGFPIVSGSWMDQWEPYMNQDYGISKSAYPRTWITKRAEMEAWRQLSHYLEGKKGRNVFPEHFARTYYPSEWAKWMEENKRPSKENPKFKASPFWSAKSIKHWRDRFFSPSETPPTKPEPPTPPDAEPSGATPTTVQPKSSDPRLLSDEQISTELADIEQTSKPLYDAILAIPEDRIYEGKGLSAKPTAEYQALEKQIQPWARRKELLASEQLRRKQEVQNKAALEARDKRVAEAPVWQRRNGWEIIKEGANYVLRDPNTKEEIYRGNLKRVRQVADESKPEPPTPPAAEPPVAKEPTQAPPPAQGPGTGVGPGSAHISDQPAAPRQAIAVGAKVEAAPPESRPMGGVSNFTVLINNARRSLMTTVRGIAGQSMPKTTAANRQLGEAGVEYASSRIAARPLAASFAARALQETGVDPVKFGAALTEDNLRSVRESMRQQATELMTAGKQDEANAMTAKADNVATMIGSEGSPFPTEEAYFDYLQRPEVKKAIQQHTQLWQEIIDPQFKEAHSIDPDVDLPSRGLQTGARINLKAVRPDEPATKPIPGTGASLTATFKKKSPFGREAKGTGLAYDVDYASIIRNTFERQLEIANKNRFDKMLVSTGNAVIDRPGQHIEIGGKPTVAFPLTRRTLVTSKEGKTFSLAENIYVRNDLANEYRTASNVDRKYNVPVVSSVMNLLNKAALAGLTDASVHVSNQATALFLRPVSGKLWWDTLASATGRIDAPIALVRAVLKGFKNNEQQVAELSKIGAMRPQDIHMGLFGKALQYTDRLTRLTLDDTYKNLVKEGLVQDTPTARREYANTIGQYNRRLQGLFTKAARDVGFGPFVTAGKTFNALGVKAVLLDPGVPAANGYAALALRVNMLSKWVGAAVLLGTMNYLITGKPMGRPGTKLGDLDTGKNDKSGKQLSIPFLSILGLGRGLRVTGLRGAIDAKRMGLTNADAIDSATRDVINAWSAPFAGPPVKFGMIAASGYSPAVNVGRTSHVVPPGESQRIENFKEALAQSSPVWQSYVKYREGKTVPEILATQIPRLSMIPGKTESMMERYPKIVSMAQGNAFIEDVIYQARRLPKNERHAFVSKQIIRLPANQREHAFREISRRRVYTN